jgi:hypothetical protein
LALALTGPYAGAPNLCPGRLSDETIENVWGIGRIRDRAFVFCIVFHSILVISLGGMHRQWTQDGDRQLPEKATLNYARNLI